MEKQTNGVLVEREAKLKGVPLIVNPHTGEELTSRGSRELLNAEGQPARKPLPTVEHKQRQFSKSGNRVYPETYKFAEPHVKTIEKRDGSFEKVTITGTIKSMKIEVPKHGSKKEKIRVMENNAFVLLTERYPSVNRALRKEAAREIARNWKLDDVEHGVALLNRIYARIEKAQSEGRSRL